ncbi:unnamed protein product, partial [Mesorhabditis spiculigera]
MKVFIFFLLVTATSGQTVRIKVKLGDPYILDIPGAKKFMRELASGEQQLFKICEDETERSLKCTHWTDKKENLLPLTSPIHAYKNGTLVVEKLTLDDVAVYWSPDVEMIVTERFEDGAPMAVMPGTMVALFLEK